MTWRRSVHARDLPDIERPVAGAVRTLARSHHSHGLLLQHQLVELDDQVEARRRANAGHAARVVRVGLREAWAGDH